MASKKKIQEEENKLFIRPKLKPLTKNQAIYLKAIQNSIITFCLGCAGTGKSYIAVGYAIEQFLEGKIKKIILSRPIIEAGGEHIGYLTGPLEDKVSPYMTPLFDILLDFITMKELIKFQEEGNIEICPLGFMRGRTLKNAIVILDEAENANYKLLKMFLTRIGENSRMILCGDQFQSDVDFEKKNPFLDCADRLEGVEGISIVELEEKDIVRHELIGKILLRLEQ